MSVRKDIWTYLLVSVVSLLIWIWAAGETREQRALYVALQFSAPDPSGWVVQSSHSAVTLTIEGSKRALEKAGVVRNEPLVLSLGADGVPGEAGGHTIDVASVLAREQKLRETGVTILASDPPTVDLTVDQIVRAPAEVRVRLPGVRTEGEVSVTPEQAMVAMPAHLRERWPEVLTVDAAVDPSRIERLEQGRAYSLEVPLRPPDGLAGQPHIGIEPPTATLTFTIRSRIRQITLDRVRVQLAGPPESYSEYRVDLSETVLRDVTVMADGDLIQRIERGEVTVVAVVHVSNRDKENGIELKPVTYFVALLADEEGTSEGIFVDAMVGDSPEMPLVHMEITALGE